MLRILADVISASPEDENLGSLLLYVLFLGYLTNKQTTANEATLANFHAREGGGTCERCGTLLFPPHPASPSFELSGLANIIWTVR